MIPDWVAAEVTRILGENIESGTGVAPTIGKPAAGKTGTTTNHADAWFVGYTPFLSTAVWVGYPRWNQPMTDVHGISVAGGTFPAQIWHDYMTVGLDRGVVPRLRAAARYAGLAGGLPRPVPVRRRLLRPVQLVGLVLDETTTTTTTTTTPATPQQQQRTTTPSERTPPQHTTPATTTPANTTPVAPPPRRHEPPPTD